MNPKHLLPLICSLLFTACGGQTPPVATTNPATSTLKLLYWQAPTILNPHLSTGFKDAEASRITLEPLASYDKSGKLILFLAETEPTVANGGIAKDGKSVTWKLKKDVKWSDGTPFTADDVVFTYKFITNPQVGATSAGTYKIVKDVQAIDPHTVKITFNDVNPAWYLVFVGTEGMILPRHLYEKYNGSNAREAPANLMPIGTGAYKVTQFKPGDVVMYQASPTYRNTSEVGFPTIELKGGGDATSAARAVLQTQEADFAYNLQIEAPILQGMVAAGKGKVITDFGSLVERIILNITDPNKVAPDGERSSVKYPHPFLSDIRVREAIGLAIDRDTITKQLYGASGKPTANMLVEPVEYNSPNTSYEFNLTKAAALLDAVGWKDSNNNGIRDKQGVEMEILFQTSINPLRQKTQEIIKQSLQSLGIKVELKTIDPGIFFSSDPSNNDTTGHFYADLQMYTTGNTNRDPAAYMGNYICQEIPQKSNQWSGDNTGRFCNKKYDELWQQSNRELDPEKRRQLLIAMNDLLIKEGVLIPLVHRAEVLATSNTLTGINITPWDLRTWNISTWKRAY